jgi:hypothetical protein
MKRMEDRIAEILKVADEYSYDKHKLTQCIEDMGAVAETALRMLAVAEAEAERNRILVDKLTDPPLPPITVHGIDGLDAAERVGKAIADALRGSDQSRVYIGDESLAFTGKPGEVLVDDEDVEL